MTAATPYPRNSWDPRFFHFVFMEEFFGVCPPGSIHLKPPPNDADTAAEIKELLRMQAQERPGALTEILQQQTAASAVEYYVARWGIAPARRKRTMEVLWAAFNIPGPVVFRLKHQFSRPRPHHLEPALVPAIDVPGHAAYPSGHSTQFHVASLLLADIIPGAAQDLLSYAWQVATNRERAGVHYRSDTEAGRELAHRFHAELTTNCGGFKQLMKEARAEW